MSFVLHQISTLLTLEGASKKRGRRIEPSDLGIHHDGCVVVGGPKNSKVLWAGSKSQLPTPFKKLKKVSAQGGTVMPGLVESHTHLIFAGDRAREFERRLEGATYQEISKEGGGIRSTVKATRACEKGKLLKLAQNRVHSFLEQGVTTIEIKTGYGLDFESEKKCLNIISRLKKTTPATLKATFLGAHAVPQEFEGQRTEYIEELTERWLPQLKNDIDAVDIFLDTGFFDVRDAEKLFQKARALKIPTKVHADELELTGGTRVAVAHNSLSADHLLKIHDEEVRLLAESETTATLLPTTAFFLKTNYAPARKLLEAGARVALSTDFNPGTSPTQDISLVGALAALEMGMRTDEIIVAMTLNGSYALGLQDHKGALLEGFDADFLILPSESPAQLFYEFGSGRRPARVYTGGKWV